MQIWLAICFISCNWSFFLFVLLFSRDATPIAKKKATYQISFEVISTWARSNRGRTERSFDFLVTRCKARVQLGAIGTFGPCDWLNFERDVDRRCFAPVEEQHNRLVHTVYLRLFEVVDFYFGYSES
ncbi:uncharacterized protein BYT42DRAFT_562194 [Radiomyces spectabilis]|uniref:uncharacterized protein n=1 Tax=Radiomyces spectabilis TaxID=64574 RepID=UPI00221F31DC|nr:uncharacterized protein BYT42DRAFT_562194 [Radiomyces spectabilis]KAI8384344.1 hypothetical protein BYT42DRAFT_562194 [Radiomyces spectabilis]